MRLAPRLALRVAPLVVSLVLVACGGDGRAPTLTGDGDEGDGASAPGSGDASGDCVSCGHGLVAASDAGAARSDCTPEATNYIYLLDGKSGFHKFDPVTLTAQRVGTLKCQTRETPWSMAVRRDGTAFSVFGDGALHSFDVTTLDCVNLRYAPGQLGITTFGMGFATDGVTANEALYVSFPGKAGLGTIDLASMTLTKVGDYDGIDARAELTGTGDGRLFGAFEGTPYVVAQIEESSAHILSQVPQGAVRYAAGQSNFAFAFWGGVFWLFVGPGGPTDVFRFDPVTRTTAKVTSMSVEIVGAGSSTCAPTAMLE